VFLPIGDDQDHDRTPWVNRALLAANAAVFVLVCLPRPAPATVESWALNPEALRPVQWLTHMFLHGDPIHVLGNLLFLWIFGRLVEERLGSAGYAALYLASGLGAAGLHLAVVRDGGPLLGSSGAISGAIGACLVFCPRAHVKVLYWLFFTAGTSYIALSLWALLWVVEQVFFASQGMGTTAYWAHLGGFITGFSAAWVIRETAARLHPPRGAPIESRDRDPRRPFAAPVDDDAVFLDDAIDAYAVVDLETPPDEAPETGVVARGLPRAQAEAKRRDLGRPAALIADQAANLPPSPRPVDSVSWDDRLVRFRVGLEVIPLPWTSASLVVHAELGTERFLDVLVSRSSAFRVAARPGMLLTKVDPARRQEESSTLDELATSFEQRRGTPCAGGRFKDAAAYADYVFRAWHLARAGRPVGRIKAKA
jgi:membrane associated rhomboid family serine protease